MLRFILLVLISLPCYAVDFSIDGGMRSYHYTSRSYMTESTVRVETDEMEQLLFGAPEYSEVTMQDFTAYNEVNRGLGISMYTDNYTVSIGRYLNSYKMISTYFTVTRTFADYGPVKFAAGMMVANNYSLSTVECCKINSEILVSPVLAITLLSSGTKIKPFIDLIILPGVAAVRPGIRF